MKSALSSLLVAVSLAGGALAAATAYLAPLSLPDEQLRGLTLNDSAGARQKPDGSLAPVAEKEDELAAARLRDLRAAGVRYVRVKEFSWRRWPGMPWFGLSLAGLLVGGLLLRSSNKRQISEARAGGLEQTPQQSLANVHAHIVALRRELDSVSAGPSALALVLDRLTALQQTEIEQFVEARDPLIAQLGLAGFAEVMDRWAAGERQINRAWSAAADGVYEETIDCLASAQTHLEEALEEVHR